ncbi:hypothetical protein REPUB_Repub08aG0101700 [Reevesia pubescens]
MGKVREIGNFYRKCKRVFERQRSLLGTLLDAESSDSEDSEDEEKGQRDGFQQGISLSPRVERDDADELRMAMKEVLCDSGKERQQYEDALVAIIVKESLKQLDANMIADSQSSFILLVLNFLIDCLAYPCDDNLSTFAVTANTFNDLIFREESQSSCIKRVDGAPVLFPLQNMDLNSARGPEKENP